MNLADRLDLARRGNIVADDLEHRGYLGAGVIRQLVRALIDPRAEEDHCPMCGKILVHPRVGRRKTYCEDRCRWRAAASKRPRKSRVVA